MTTADHTPTQILAQANYTLSRGFVPKINVFNRDFIQRNNQNRAEAAFDNAMQYLADSGEWMKAKAMLGLFPVILRDSEVLSYWTQRCQEAAGYATDFKGFQAMYKSFPETHGGPLRDKSLLQLGRYTAVFELMQPHKSNVRSVLSVGCGEGSFDDVVLGAHPDGCQYVIADVAEAESVQKALQERHPKATVTLHKTENSLYDWPLATFDAVFALEIIEHMPNQDDFIAELWGRVAPGGALYLSTPDASIWVSPDKGTGAEHHITANTPETLQALLATLPDIASGQITVSEENHIVAKVVRA